MRCWQNSLSEKRNIKFAFGFPFPFGFPMFMSPMTFSVNFTTLHNVFTSQAHVTSCITLSFGATVFVFGSCLSLHALFSSRSFNAASVFSGTFRKSLRTDGRCFWLWCFRVILFEASSSRGGCCHEGFWK